MGLFKKKKGGTFFGNLLATVASKASGGVLGSKRVALLQSGQIAAINPDAEAGKTMKAFAGEAATQSKDGTINMAKPLDEVTVTAKPLSVADVKSSDVGIIEKMLGDKLSYLTGRATENATVGADNKTLMMVGGAALAIVLAVVLSKK